MKITNNLILAITFLPMVLGFYFSFSDLQLSVFCFALFGFMVFFYQLCKHSTSMAESTELMKILVKTHYLSASWAALSASLLLVVEWAELLIVALFVSCLLMFMHLSWAYVKSKININYMQLIARVYQTKLTLLVILALILVVCITRLVVLVLDSATTLEPIDVLSMPIELVLIYCIHNSLLEAALRTEQVKEA